MECEWCEVCTRPICDDCDPAHDCMAEHLAEDDGPNPEPAYDEDDDTEDLFEGLDDDFADDDEDGGTS